LQLIRLHVFLDTPAGTLLFVLLLLVPAFPALQLRLFLLTSAPWPVSCLGSLPRAERASVRDEVNGKTRQDMAVGGSTTYLVAFDLLSLAG
jgi:hypothetical protein